MLDHALIADNGDPSQLDVAVPFTSRYSLIRKPNANYVDNGGGNLFDVDPQLEPLYWFSPTIAVRAIPVTSPALNAGDPDFTPPPDTDQTGAPRKVQIVDIGAYEVQVLVPRFAG